MSIAANVVTHAAKATQLSRISQAPKAQKNTAVPAIGPRVASTIGALAVSTMRALATT